MFSGVYRHAIRGGRFTSLVEAFLRRVSAEYPSRLLSAGTNSRVRVEDIHGCTMGSQGYLSIVLKQSNKGLNPHVRSSTLLRDVLSLDWFPMRTIPDLDD